MKIYNPEDCSLVELISNHEEELLNITSKNKNVHEYAKFEIKDYELVVSLEDQITKHGHMNLCQTPADTKNYDRE